MKFKAAIFQSIWPLLVLLFISTDSRGIDSVEAKFIELVHQAANFESHRMGGGSSRYLITDLKIIANQLEISQSDSEVSLNWNGTRRHHLVISLHSSIQLSYRDKQLVFNCMQQANCIHQNSTFLGDAVIDGVEASEQAVNQFALKLGEDQHHLVQAIINSFAQVIKKIED